jgi:hypothetical protein
LAGDPAGLPVCYSPAKVERARLYQEEKEAKEVEQRRQIDARKAQRAINAAINKEKKDAKDLAAQLARELNTQNKGTITASPKKKKIVVPKTKKPTIVMQKAKKPSTPKKSRKEAPKEVVVVEEVVEVVVSKNRQGREIVLPTRFK